MSSVVSPRAASNTIAKMKEYYLRKIRHQYKPGMDFEDAKIANLVITQFKNQTHDNTRDELLQEWIDYRDENGREEDKIFNNNNDDINIINNNNNITPTPGGPDPIDNNDNDLPSITPFTPQRTIEDEESIEETLLLRHVNELLYNLILASHWQMKLRKDKLVNELKQQTNDSILKDTGNNPDNYKKNKQKQKQKMSSIIAKYLPKNKKTMKNKLNFIYCSIVSAHYSKCIIFIDIKKTLIMEYISKICEMSFLMLLSRNELSFFPLLFTDQSSSYIYPVIRFDKIIKKNQKNIIKNRVRSKSKSTTDLEIFISRVKTKKADNKFDKKKHQRTFSSLSKTVNILYYEFPGVLSIKNNKVLVTSKVFTYDDPSIFVRHDINWIFVADYYRKKIAKKYTDDHDLAQIDDDDDDDGDDQTVSSVAVAAPIDPYQCILPKMNDCIEKISFDNSLFPNTDYISETQLLRSWCCFKKQTHDDLCERIMELIQEEADDDDIDDDDDDYKDDLDDDDDGDYEYSKISSSFLYSVMIRSRYIMKQKLNDNSISIDDDDKYNIIYLNMYSLYKYSIKNKNKQLKDNNSKYCNIICSIINEIFNSSISCKQYTQYKFIENDLSINVSLHEFIAKFCELIYNLLYYSFDICPLKIRNNIINKSLIKFDDTIHIKDNNLSSENSKINIDYCSFPGIYSSNNEISWKKFQIQYAQKKLKPDDINKHLKCKMWTCLKDIKNNNT